MSEDILSAIDASIAANLCGCGCGQQIPVRGPSPDFVNEKHQQVWSKRGYRNSGGTLAADWYDRLRQTTDDLIDEAWRTAPAPTVRRGGISWSTIPVEFVDCEDCDDLNCPCHDNRSPALRVTEANPPKLPVLRRAINRIRGIAK